MRKFRWPYITVLMLSVITALTLFNCKFSFAKDKKPEEGSIRFGAAEKPEIDIPHQLSSFKTIFADIAEKVTPSVVSIRSTKIDTIVYTNPFQQFFGNPFDQFFGVPRNRQDVEPQKKERRVQGLGSGVIVSEDGYILTNRHVIKDADEILVETYDDREFEAEIIGSDSLSDVAVIKIKGDVKGLPAVYFGNSDELRPGDWVMAVGSPFNLTSTVTTGIVSALGRHTSGITMYQNFIQTDAAINPGNSGGALVNIEGALIGINTMIFSKTGGYMGIGFAIPVNMARTIMEKLIYKGEVSRGWLGVGIEDIDINKKKALGLSTTRGVLINNIFEGQPAEKAGIKVGDVILSIDDIQITNANELKNTVASIEPGEKISVKLIRDGREKTLKVTLAKREEDKIKEIASGGSSGSDNEEDNGITGKKLEKRVGFTAHNLTREIRRQYGIDNSIKGIIISDIDPASRAAREGIREGDIISKAKLEGHNMVYTTDISVFKKVVSKGKKGDSILLYLIRRNQSFFAAFKLE